MEEDSFILKDAKIIAMTTTGSSRYHSILKNIEPRIVIVEEAAEVFEAHIVASLSKNCEHLILIGDHIQLRPNPTVYKLAKDYKLDVSLFERLINNNTKKVMLTCQHRMRPDISNFMKHFYPEPIIDHVSVKSFENIIGITKNVFFINHHKEEKALTESQSKVNLFEAKYIAKLCEYLAKNKYKEQSITVLSMYLGQMMQIKSELRALKMKFVKISTVDNYQGEENDIIILSLVRSNRSDKIGFLKTYNRVCVALSRARKALFCIGNLDFISKNSDKWLDIVKTAKEGDFFGEGLTLTCGSHTKNDILAQEPADFELRPDGGCQLACDFRLDCGHSCALKCHTFDKTHQDYTCQKLCSKEIPTCKHLCQKSCSHHGDCNKCSVMVDKIIPECGHSIRFRCDTSPSQTDCKHDCPKTLSCGHLCTKLCRVLECEPCATKIPLKLACKHETLLDIECAEADSAWKRQQKCSLECADELECGHLCTSQCGQCFGGYIHQKCSSKCDRVLFCGHVCQSACSEQCKPCQMKCQNKCAHSKCAKLCYEPCSPCLERCTWKCEHFECGKLCHELCDRPACDQPCRKKLKCGHECIGLCGEPCPKLCRICQKEKVSRIFFGTEDEPDARFVFLKDCGHVLEVTGMDGWIKSRYGEDQSESVDKNNEIQLPVCAKCKTPIRLNLRYSNDVKKQLSAIETIKSMQIGDQIQNKILKNSFDAEIKSYVNSFKSSSYLVEIYTNLLRTNIERNPNMPYNHIVSLKNAFGVFKELKKMETKSLPSLVSFKPSYQHVKYEINKILGVLYGSSSNKINLLENQCLNEAIMEIERLKAVCNYYSLKHFAEKQTFKEDDRTQIKDKLNRLEGLLVGKILKFKGETKKEVDGLISSLKDLVKMELSREEKMMVVKAMGLTQGHWFKCKNGHVYCIGECGGAMQISRCPECNCEIGGTNHTLLADNQLASEMDGAQHAAWSETANNFANFNLNNL
jgi:hypothetical protein